MRGEDHGFDRTVPIFELHRGPQLSFLIALALNAGENAAERDFDAFLQTFQVVGVVRGQLGDFVVDTRRADGR